MIIISWNVKGLGDTRHRSDIKLLIQKYIPDNVILQETKIIAPNFAMVKELWGQRAVKFEGIDDVGAFGGLWVLWDPFSFHCVRVERRDRILAIFFQGPSSGTSWGIVNVYGPVIPSLKEGFLTELGDILLSHNDIGWKIVKALPSLSSDHIPLLLNTIDSNNGSKTFRLELVWLKEPGVVDLIKSTWGNSISFGSVDFQLHKKLLNVKH
ncbi:hypothetical protein AMTRI_Chr01g126400 [Amborella trichopoda]